MLARLLSIYVLVLSVFVYLYLVLCASNFYLHENLYQMLAGLLLQCCPCLSMSLSLQRSSELSFYYCLQSFSLSLSNSVPLSPSFFMKCQIYCQRLLLLCHVKALRQRLIFWVFVAGEFVTDRQR